MRRSVLLMSGLLLSCASPSRAAPGDWPRPRQNSCLTAIQPLPGDLAQPPRLLARYDLGRTRPAVTGASLGGSGIDRGLCLVNGALHCYDLEGALRWRSHPPGLNFAAIAAVADVDQDGQPEIVLQAGRPTPPFGAAAVVGLADGQLRWSCEVEPMSYWWSLHVDHFLPGSPGPQVVVLMQGYPPDPRNGYIALFASPGPGQPLQQCWRYEFSDYTCFPSLLRSDLDGDGVREICVQSHSRMWVLDPGTGQLRQFLQWDVSPANVRSYGLVRFVDLDNDGREDFLCLANFAQHHEVLLNRGGRLELVWAHGWAESVTTGKVATTWPDPPYADLDNDGRLELVLSMFNSEDEQNWLLRVYQTCTGELRYRRRGAIALAVADLDVDGAAEIFAAFTTDPTRNALDGVAVLKATAGGLTELWRLDEPVGLAADPSGFCFLRQGIRWQVEWQDGQVRLSPCPLPAPPAGPDFSRLPPVQGPPPAPLLVADVDGDGRNEVLVYRDQQVLILSLQDDHSWREKGRYPSSGLPALADLDGDGVLELAIGLVEAGATPRLEAWSLARNCRLWSTALPPPAGRIGLPYGRPLYLQAGRFTGKASSDLYAWVGAPLVRSLVLDGQTGQVVWEKGEIEGQERFWGPSVNQAASWDFDNDGAEDLVFTNPDYYCALSGLTGAVLCGPAFPPRIFDQPSQGLYSFPALLEREGQPPLVCLAGAHYFVGVMSLDARACWHHLPIPGENRAGDEGFVRTPEGRWLMGFGRQNGRFACLDLEDGSLRWELPVGATCTDVVAGDLDDDGHQEFLFGTSHGQLWAVRDAGGRPQVLWQADLPAGCGPPLIADVDGDGTSEILLCTLDGYLVVLDS